MALSDVKQVCQATGPGLIGHLRAALTDRVLSGHAKTQRMAGAAFAIRILSAGILFGSQVLLARWMGSHQFGTYVYVWAWLQLVSDLVHLGLPLTAQRFVPEYTQAGSTALLRGYLGASRWLTFAAGGLAGLIGALVVYCARNVIDPQLLLPFYFACVALPVYSVTFMSDALARSYDWINLALLPAYVLRPLIFIAALGIMQFIGVKLDVTIVMGVLVAASWLAALPQTLQLNRSFNTVVPAGRKSYELRRWLATGLPIVFVWGLYTLLTSIDVLVLKQFRSAAEVAHYYAAAKTLALVSIIYFAVAATSAHRFAALYIAKDRAELEAFAAATVRWIFWLSLAACLLIVALGQPLLMLFGGDYVAAYPVIVILAFGQLARASVGPAERVLNVLGRQRACACAYAAAFAVNVGGCLLLAPVYGAVGAAIATAAAFVVESASLFVIAKRSVGLHMFIWGVGKGNRGNLRAATPRSPGFMHPRSVS